MSTRVGIIGLGLLGSAIAERLVAAGWEVHGCDPRVASQAGVQLHQESGDVFAACDRVFFSLPSSAIAASVVAGTGERIRSGHVIIDTTTGEPGEVIAIAAEVAARGGCYVEANVAGSSVLLRSGEAALFLAGDEDVIRTMERLLSDLAHQRFHLGAAGSASRFKLVHNLVLGLHRAVLAEGLQFAASLGFDPGQTLALLQQTPAVSGVMATKGQRMIERRFDPPQARLSQHLKDVRLMLAEAGRTGARLPLSTLHCRLLEEVAAAGLGDADNAAIIEAFTPHPQ